ncbi:glycyl-radical enzyme activating protein [Chimaeribacter californicus]|uniref:Glycyl-radical enzyme activating protein n=1 Tax=Chimaeribacter californicus TaxID=2060067 RepID=A0A2N5EGK7_9GAMM|nr:glycyl-radical enzyme activating protein [Chimaeribacter californicus]PLR41682.1 glycyl-radical enzyme activating protein [Chimaeribacter californicus]
MLFNLQRYSTHDGPGIRTVVFLKGCSLSCRWCQNPESRARTPDLLFDPRLCIAGCRECSQRCPEAVTHHQDQLTLHRERLTDADQQALAAACPSGALSLCGEALNLDSVMATLLRDRPFYQRSGGGITLSGGEPFMQPDTCAALLQRCRAEELHTAVESCLHVPWRYIAPSLPHLSLLLADLKHVDEARFRDWTGGSARRVMSNFRRLAQAGVPVIVRVPVIPGFNADCASLRAIIDFAADETCCKEIHFLPYHTLGINKYALLNQPYTAPATPLDDPALLAFARHYARRRGLNALLRG